MPSITTKRTILARNASLSCSGLAMVAVLLAGASPAAAQSVPGVDAECTIDASGNAVCEGDLADGVQALTTTPSFGTLTVRNPNAAIEPFGIPGVAVLKNDRDVAITIASDVSINTRYEPTVGNFAQGVLALVSGGFDLSLNNGAAITMDGNGSFGLGIEAIVEGGTASLDITNSGNIDTFTSNPGAIALQGRAEDATGDLTIANSGDLSASSGGTGERDFVTAGIFAFHNAGGATIAVDNSGDIDVAATTTDSNFGGIASGIVTNAYGAASDTTIVNTGAISNSAQAGYGITGYTETGPGGTSTIAIDNRGAISITGEAGAAILGQSFGDAVDIAIDNSGALSLNPASGFARGIYNWNQATNATSSVINTAPITGSGDELYAINVSSSGAPATGTYTFSIVNSGNITFDAAGASGLSMVATRDDTITATIENSGDIDFSTTTDVLSTGIFANFGIPGTSMTPATTNEVAITNHGDITMGSGNAIYAEAGKAQITNSGTLSTSGADSHGILIVSDDIFSSVVTTGDITVTGDGSSAIFGRTNFVAVRDGATVSSANGTAIELQVGAVEIDETSTVASSGGAGIMFADGGSVRLYGSLTGGNGSAIDFGVGRGVLELHQGSSITGTVTAGEDDDLLFLRSSSNFSDPAFPFDLDTIGTQFNGFEYLQANGSTPILFTGSGSFALGVDLTGLSFLTPVQLDNATLTSGGLIEANFLEGTGTLSSLAVGNLSPGLGDGAIGTINTGDLQIDSLTVDFASASSFDLVDVTGTVTLVGGFDGFTLDVNGVGSFLQSADPFTAVVLNNDGTDAIVGTVANIDEDLPFLNVSATTTGGDGNDLALNFYIIPLGDPDVTNGCSPSPLENNVVAYCSGVINGADEEPAVDAGDLVDVTINVLADAVITPGTSGTLSSEKAWGIQLGEGGNLNTEAGSVVNGGVDIFSSTTLVDLAGTIAVNAPGALDNTDATQGLFIEDRRREDTPDSNIAIAVRGTGAINTAGDYNDAIAIQQLRTGLTLLGEEAPTSVVMDGTITTTGDFANGIYQTVGLVDRVEGSFDIGGSITTSGDNATAILLEKDRSESEDLPLSTAPALTAFAVNISGSLATSGEASHGVSIAAEGNFYTHNVTVADGGEIAVTGAGSNAINLAERFEEYRIRDTVGPVNTAPSQPVDAFITLEEGSRIYSQNGLAVSDAEGTNPGQGHNTTLRVAGTIAGDDANATVVQLGSSTDTVILESTYSITGVVDGGSGDDVFVLGGDTDGTFDITQVDFNGMAGATDRFVNFEGFAKQGDSTWTITGTPIDDIALGLAVQQGQLNVDGNLAGEAVLLSGGVLGGAGSVGDITGTGGIVAPGNSIAALNTGSLMFDANTTYQVEVDAMGNADLLVVTGTVDLNGATLDVVEVGDFTGVDPFNYLIIDNDADDAVLSQFGTVQNDYAFLTPTVSYTGGDGNDVTLTLTVNGNGGDGDEGGCTPDAANGVDAVCSGVFDEDTPPNGYGAFDILNATVLVEADAVITPTGAGIILGSGASIKTEAGSRIEPQAGTLLNGRDGIAISGIGTIDHAGSITVADPDAFGIAGREGQDFAVLVRPTGSITTSGNGGHGMMLNYTGGNAGNAGTVTMDGTITTTGTRADGIWLGYGADYGSQASGSVGSLSVGGTIEVFGAESSGIYAVLGDQAAVSITLTDGADVSATGDTGYGIYLSNAEAPTQAISTVADTGTTSATATVTIEEGATLFARDDAAFGEGNASAAQNIDTTLTIAGEVARPGTGDIAVDLSTGDDTLILLPTYSVTGQIDGGDGTDTFVLDGAAGTTGEIALLTGNTARAFGFEDLRKRGEGTWIITGDDVPESFPIPLATIEAGTLLVNANVPGADAELLAGATLGGSGTIGDVTSTGGTVAPGNSIGTLSVGNLSLDANSVLQVEADATSADMLQVTGTVALGGATLDVVEVGDFTGSDPFTYTIIDNDADDAVNGTFGTIQNDYAFLTPSVSYTGGDGNDVTLALTPTATPTPTPTPTPLFTTAAQTFNQFGAASALDGFDRTDADADLVYMAVLFTTTQQALQAFDTTSGEIYPTMLADAADRRIDANRHLLARAYHAGSEGWGIWGGFSASTGNRDGDGNAAAADIDGLRADIGFDYRGAGNRWAVGIEFGYNQSDLTVPDRMSSADAEGWHVGGYLRGGTGGTGLSGSVAASWSDMDADVTRNIEVNTLNRSTFAQTDLSAFAVSGEMRYGFEAGENLAIGPVAGVHHASSDLGSISETGAGSLNLSSGGGDEAITNAGIGLFANWQGESSVVDASVQYFGGDSTIAQLDMVLAGNTSSRFPVRSAAVESDGVLSTVSAMFGLGGGWSVGLEGQALFGADREDYAAQVTIGWQF